MKTKRFVTTAMAVMFGASVIFTGCGSVDKNATLITINDGEATISLGYGNFSARYQQSMYDQYLMGYYGEGMWSTDMSGDGSTFQENVKSDVLDTIEEQYLCKIHASEYGISLTDDDNKSIAEAAKKFINDNPKETVEALGATEDIVKEYLEYRTYATLVQNAVKDAADVTVTEDECWKRTFSYVLFDTSNATDEDGNAVEMSENEKAVLKQAAEGLSTAEDYDGMANSLGRDISTYSYTKGDTEDTGMDAAVITAAEALKTEGAVSDVVEVEGKGYYVIRLDADHDEDASESAKESLISERKSEAYTQMLDSWKEAITWTVDEKNWAKVEFETLFKTMEVEEESTDEATEADAATEDTAVE